MKTSIFNGFADKSPKESNLQAIVRLIQNDSHLRVLTENHKRYRKEGKDQLADTEKSHAPCFSVAVTFKEGKQRAHIHHWTGRTLVDLDHLPAETLDSVREKIRKDPHTELLYTTLSGKGIRIVAPYAFPEAWNEWINTPFSELPDDKQKLLEKSYKKIFLAVNRYYETLTGLPADEKCKNPTRLSAMAHDPEVFYRSDATSFVVDDWLNEKPVKKGGRNIKPEEVEAAIFQELKQRKVSYEAGSHNSYISQACYLMNRYGVAEAAAEEWALTTFADYAEHNNVSAIVHSCYQMESEHGTLKVPKGAVSKNASIRELQDYFLRKEIRVRHNLISRKNELYDVHTDTWNEITDRDVHSIYRAFCIETDLRIRISELFILIESDFYPLFHPFKAYLENLPEWDGHDYIEDLASSVHVAGNAQSLHNRFFKKWFVAMIAAWVDEDKTNHEILTYIGPQGIYKSTFVRHLLPPELQAYFSTKNFAGRMNKDDKLELTEMGLISLEELDSLQSHELNQLKAVTTDPTVNERAPFARYKERRQHIASFCGTGNNPRFLTDLTENRRWLPFLVDSIDSPWEKPFNYVGIYSQAYSLWKNGFPYWFDSQENQELSLHNRLFEEPCLEEELVTTYFRVPYGNEVGEFLTTSRIIELINGMVKIPLNPRKIVMVMKKLGFTQRRIAIARGWNVIILTGEEIKNQQKLQAHKSNPE